MHRVFQTFIDRLYESADVDELRASMAEVAAAFDLSCFAYLSGPSQPDVELRHITTYPLNWTEHYLSNHYERLDSVVYEALSSTEPFKWGTGIGPKLSRSQQQVFDEAASFGIRCGYTIPIHDGRGPIAAMTFAAGEQSVARFYRCIAENGRALQLMALYFHAHARRKLASHRIVDGAVLSPREFECLTWAARGKTGWEIGRIVGISRRTAAFHLDNAKAKLGVRSICQAVALLVASNHPG
jgi:DNA-binding CsgD family transcriptional regulator